MEEETLFLFIPYIVKARGDAGMIRYDDDDEYDNPEEIDTGYVYKINRASLKKTDSGEAYKRTPIHFEPVIGENCHIIKIINNTSGLKGTGEKIYFPFIFDSIEAAQKETELILKGEYTKYLHSKERFGTVEIVSVKITEY